MREKKGEQEGAYNRCLTNSLLVTVCISCRLLVSLLSSFSSKSKYLDLISG